MDTLTHALLGSLVVRASLRRSRRPGDLDRGTATLAGGVAAAFPDIDYLSFWIAPLTFLAEWHRGPTHSLLMAPFWALLLGLILAALFRRPRAWRAFAVISLLALGSHVASDLITAYGTRIFWPLSDVRVALGTTFVIDPFFTALVVGGLGFSLLLSHPTTSARIGLLALAGYLGFQSVLQQQAKSVGEQFATSQSLAQSSVHALPQPLSPFNWLIIVSDGQRHHAALVNLAYMEETLPWARQMGWPGKLWTAYRPPRDLVWETHYLYGERDFQRELVRQAWQLEAFAEFRRFAKFPVLYRIDHSERQTCVWYTDLRYVLPGLTPPFRYGLCGEGPTDSWLLYRLRRFTDNDRHYLGGPGAERELRGKQDGAGGCGAVAEH
jgi:inner membrane protein